MAAGYVARILKGEQAGDLPVVHVVAFEFVLSPINALVQADIAGVLSVYVAWHHMDDAMGITATLVGLDHSLVDVDEPAEALDVRCSPRARPLSDLGLPA